jgi:hypothetical protein
MDVSLEIYPFLRRTFLKLLDVVFVRCGVFRSVDSSAKLNRDEADFVVFDRFAFLDDQRQYRFEGVGSWILLWNSCGKHLCFVVFVDLDPSDELGKRRYFTSLSSK